MDPQISAAHSSSSHFGLIGRLGAGEENQQLQKIRWAGRRREPGVHAQQHRGRRREPEVHAQQHRQTETNMTQ